MLVRVCEGNSLPVAAEGDTTSALDRGRCIGEAKFDGTGAALRMVLVESGEGTLTDRTAPVPFSARRVPSLWRITSRDAVWLVWALAGCDNAGVPGADDA